MRAFGLMSWGLAIAGVLLASTALAQGAGGGMEMGFGGHRSPMENAFGPQSAQGRFWNNPRLVEKLKLSDVQRKEFDDIYLQHREKLIDLRANLQKAELALEPLVREDPPNEAKILAQIDKVAQARAELEKANAAFLLAIRSKLTAEQWTELQALRANRANNLGGAGQRGLGQGNWRQGGGYNRQTAPSQPPPPASSGPGAPPVPPSEFE
ncbi:MAG: Spy/CpxP family protein refolding chaperone [Terracidiphilus sp.]|jgi:Spy/CpxP family protein refolding chaperone